MITIIFNFSKTSDSLFYVPFIHIYVYVHHYYIVIQQTQYTYVHVHVLTSIIINFQKLTDAIYNTRKVTQQQQRVEVLYAT